MRRILKKSDKDLNAGLVVRNDFLIFIVHSFVHSFIQQLFITCLLGARHCAWHWGSNVNK